MPRACDRRRFLGLLLSAPVATLLACSAPAGQTAQAPDARERRLARPPVIGVLHLGQDEEDAPLVVGLREGLRRLGYIEGRDIVLEIRAGQGRPERAEQAARDLVAARVRMLVAAGTVATQAAQQAAAGLPIVFTQVGDPVAAGFVHSLARPGGNMTGFSHQLPAATGKRLELLREIAPTARRVTMIYDPSNPSSRAAAEVAWASAEGLAVDLQVHHVGTRDDVLAVLSGLQRASTDAVLVLPDSLVVNAGVQIIDVAMRERLPVMFHEDTWVRRGGLASYGASFVDLGNQAATYVDRILKGANPADLPVQQATRFELVLNLGVAEALGLAIPAVLLARADEVLP